MFQPSAGLKSGTDYQVKVDSSLKDTTGTQIGSGFEWSFTTRAPYVYDFGLKNVGNGYTDTIPNVLLDQVFLATFNQPMDKDSVAAALSMRNAETGRQVPLKLAWDKTFTILTITPANRLSVASFYNLSIATSAKAQDGGTLKNEYNIKLSTAPLPAVTSVTPADGKQSTYSPVASVVFNTPMKGDSMKGRVKIIPEPKNPVNLIYLDGQNQLNIFGFEPSTDYVVRLLPGMQDIYGNAIRSEYSFRFQTAGMTPQGRLVTPGYPLIYRTGSDQGIFFEYTNLDSASISLYKLSFDEFSGLSYGIPEMDNLGESSGKLLRTWTPDLLAGKDRFARVLLHLDDQGPLSPGYYYLGLTARPLTPRNRFLQGALFIVSDDSLTLKTTQDEALAWLVDSNTGQPVPGAEVHD